MKTTREDLLEVLGELGELFPDWRFGQLVANVATAARGPDAEEIWECDDEELLSAARRLVEGNQGRLETSRFP